MATSAHPHRLVLGTAICALFTGIAATGLYMANSEPEPITFKDIPEKGDSRLKRVVAQMRKTTDGEKLYQYASQNGLSFKWDSHSENAGSYRQRSVSAGSYHTDDTLVFVLAHEIYHGWQDINLGYNDKLNDPRLTWQLDRVAEVSSCAYTAHFTAQYKMQTGTALEVSPTIYGNSVASDYATLPASQRNFYYHAVLPCFDSIKDYSNYTADHFLRAMLVYKMGRNHHDSVDARIKLAEAKNSDYEPRPGPSPFIPFSNIDRAKLLSSFFTTTLDTKDIPADLSPADPEKFMALIERETKPTSWEMAADIQLFDQEFHKIGKVAEAQHQAGLARNKDRAMSANP